MIEERLRSLIVGKSPPIRRVREMIMRVGPSQLPVLIQGPTGAGKELVARGIHLASGRSGEFVPCNVCALNEALFESTFFGHVRGAFTGAVDTISGHLADANGGTMFLDEIGGLPLGLQPKLLRALDDKSFRQVGAARDRWSDFRVVAATNDELGALVASGRFRADLLHRLDGISIRVPPLADRPEDVPLLAFHFLERITRKAGAVVTLSEGAIAELQRRTWSGNVRELGLAIERAVLFACDGVIDMSAVRAALGPGKAGDSSRAHVAEREHVMNALRTARGDTRAAAQLLGVSRPTIYRYLNRFGLSVRTLAASETTCWEGGCANARGVGDSQDSHGVLENSHENGRAERRVEPG